MKNNVKAIIASSVAALAFGAISVGTTFALFTSNDEATIEVNSGKINVACNVAIDSVYELNNDQPLVPTQNVYVNSIGGTTSIDGNNVILNNWAPGDKVVLDVQNVNKSTVKALTRLAISHGTVDQKGDLYPALNITVRRADEEEPIDPVDLFKWTLRDAAENQQQGDLIEHLKITVEFPDHDNGEIVFDSNNNDNQYQDCACVIALGFEAIQGNAYVSPIETFNDYVDYIGGVITMHDAIVEANKFEYSVSTFNGYVWDTNRYNFVPETSVNENYYQYFKAYEEMPSTPTFSIYANASSWDETVTLNSVGFDAGDATGISLVSYSNDIENRSVLIRTNSSFTDLTINDGSTGTINHYGPAGSLNIIQCHTSSYHENGKVAFAEIAKGRIVLEKESEINQIHINKKEDVEAFNEIIIKDNGASSLPSKITRDQVAVEGEKELVVKVVSSNDAEENVYVYPYTDSSSVATGTTEKTSSQNSDVNSTLGTLVLDNGQDAGEKAMSNNEKEEAQEAAVEEARNEEVEHEDEEYVARNGAKGYQNLQDAFDEANENDTIIVLKDINLSSSEGFIVNKTVTLDLNSKTISGNHDALFVVGCNELTYQPSSTAALTHTGHLTICGNGSIINTNWDTMCVFPDARLDLVDVNVTGVKVVFYIYGGELNIDGGDFHATGTGASYLVQLKNGGSGNILSGNFTTVSNNGCYGVFMDKASTLNLGELGEEGPSFETFRPCVATNGSLTGSCTINIYSGTYRATRNNTTIDDQNVIQLANASSELQTLNIYGGHFEQTSHLENSCIIAIKYGGDMDINISGGTFVSENGSPLFSGYGTTASGFPSLDNVNLVVENEAISHDQYVEVYSLVNKVFTHLSERDFVLYPTPSIPK